MTMARELNDDGPGRQSRAIVIAVLVLKPSAHDYLTLTVSFPTLGRLFASPL
jgi:hypothetical protein